MNFQNAIGRTALVTLRDADNIFSLKLAWQRTGSKSPPKGASHFFWPLFLPKGASHFFCPPQR